MNFVSVLRVLALRVSRKMKHQEIPEYPWRFADEETVEETVQETGVSEHHLISALQVVQERYSDYGEERFMHQEGPGGLARVCRESSGVFPLAETDDYIVVLSRDEKFNDVGNDVLSYQFEDEVIEAVHSHHRRAAYDRVNDLEEKIGLVNESDTLWFFKTPEYEDSLEKSSLESDLFAETPEGLIRPAIFYDYNGDGLFSARYQWVRRGDFGTVRFFQEVEADKEGFTVETEVQNVRIEHGSGESTVCEFEDRVEYPSLSKSFRWLNSAKEEAVADLSDDDLRAFAIQSVFETMVMSQEDYLNRAITEGLSCDKCEQTQSVSEGRYVLYSTGLEEGHPLSHAFVHACTDCLTEFIERGTMLTERQAQIYAYQEVGLSHSATADELNKHVEDEEDEVSASSISGATSAIRDKIGIAEKTTNFLEEKTVRGR